MLTKIIVLSIYVAILFIIGWVASKRVKTMSDYYVGGKNLGFWAVAFSARATGESGWLLIGLTGMGAMSGLSAYWVVVGEVLGVAVSWWLMAKRFKRKSDEYKSITVPDYLQSHFKSSTNTLRIIAASVLAIFVVIYVSAQIDATGVAFESMLGGRQHLIGDIYTNITYHWGAIIGFLIVLAYIFIGGFVAVVWSDFFQGVLMFFGLILLPIVIWVQMDHGQGIIDGLNSIDPALTNIWGGHADLWMNIFTMLGFAMIGLGFLGSPQVYVRFMSIKKENEIDKGKWVAVIFTLLTDAAAVTIGILARIYFTEQGDDPVNILGVGGKEVLDMVTTSFLTDVPIAIYVAIVLSAIMSTIDSLLVLASSAITRDFYQKIFRPDLKDEDLTNISRAVTLIMAMLALGLAMLTAYLSPDRQIFWTMIFGWSGIAATFCPVIILTLFWKGYTEKGAIASMISGFLCVPFFKFGIPYICSIGSPIPSTINPKYLHIVQYFEKLDVLAPSFAVAMLVGFAVSKFTKGSTKIT